MFFPPSTFERKDEKAEREQRAKAICASCSVRKDCLVFRAAAGLALSVIREVNGKIGYPTPVLEKALNLPVTTRSWTTIVRLVERHD